MSLPVTFTLTKYIRTENANTQLEAYKTYQTPEIHPYWNIKTKRLGISEKDALKNVLSHYFKDFYVFSSGILTITAHNIKLWMQVIL